MIRFTVQVSGKVDFPLYLRVPAWCKGATLIVNGETVAAGMESGKYVRLGLKFTAFSKNQKHTFSTYASAQHIVRNSYYSAYGMTTDFTGVLGAQYIYHFDKCLFMPADLTGGFIPFTIVVPDKVPPSTK